MISIWILCTNIITKSFSSVFLNTYFKINPKLKYNTIEDLIENPVSIAGSMSLSQMKTTKPLEFEILNKRVSEYENELGINTYLNRGWDNHVLSSDVENGKTVLLVITGMADVLKSLFLGENVKTSDNKYFPFFLNHFVHKRVKFANNIFKL